MPMLTQGNIFDVAMRTQLAVVFGHIGFNLMSMHWRAFAHRTPKLSDLANPFRERPQQPIEWSEGRWLWMVPYAEAEGLTDAEHERALGEAVTWALQNSISSIVTNGASGKSSGVRSKGTRAEWLIAYAKTLEKSHGVAIALMSLRGVYLANMQAPAVTG